jgi:WD40 repeat protein
MPRPERPLDPTDSTVARFAHDLRSLRRQSGSPTYRTMAETTRYSATTLAEAAGGRRLPALTVVLEFVRACGGDPIEWERRWRTVASQVADDRGDGGADPPYRGLAAFEPADADSFFGREALVEQLLDRLAESGLVAVSGASGSGKSSLLRAGLLPAAADRGWRPVLCTPGEYPMRRLDEFDGRAADGLLIVDQFEEVFTLCRDERERTAFLDRLVAAAGHRVVVAVRADFLVRCAGHAGLAAALGDGTVVVGAMSADGLRRAIGEPARRAGLSVERAMVAQVLAEVEGQPGALPLVSHALLETWRQRQGTVLTLSGYLATGGVSGAIAQTAEQVYAGLTAGQQRIAAQVLVRLTALGEGSEDTRRRVHRDELDLPGVQPVLDAFAAARLIVVDEQTVELAHEAVIAAWPRLRGWLTEDRDAWRTHRQLTEAATLWRSLGRDPGSLYRGARLAIAREWAASPARRALLNPTETEFLDAGFAAEAAERSTAVRRARQLRRLTAALAALLAVVTVLAGTALWQWRTAEHERRQALSRQLAAQAVGLARVDVAEAMRLSVAAYQASPTVEARGALLSLASRRSYAGRLQHDSPLRDVVFSPDSATVATADTAGRIVLWDVARRTPVVTLTGHRAAVRALAYGPGGAVLGSAGADGAVLLWDPATGRQVRALHGHDGVVDGLAFAPDGRRLATIGADHRILLWNPADGARTGAFAGHGGRNAEVAFTPDGRVLLSAGDDGAVVAWDAATGARIRAFGAGEPLHTVAVSPDGALVAAAGEGPQVQVWRLADGVRVAALRAHTAVVSAVRFADAGRLVSVGYDGSAVLWDIRAGRRVVNLVGGTSSLFGAAASPDGRLVAAVGRDRSALLWDRSVSPLTGHTDEITALGVAPDGGTVASGDAGGGVLLWRTSQSPANWPAPLPGPAAGVADVAFAADGRLLAGAGQDGVVRLWDPARPDTPHRTLRGHTDQVRTVAFHPAGRLLASGGADRDIRLWTLPGGAPLTVLRQPDTVVRVAFSRDGATLIAAAQDGTITVWDSSGWRVRRTVRDSPGILGLALHPDGGLAAVGRPDGTIALWDLVAGAVTAVLRGHQGPVPGVAFSPDGTFLASGGFDETAVLWSVADRRVWARLQGHGADVLSVAWHPDGSVVYTGSTDHSITAWRVDPAAARGTVCADLPALFPGTAAAECPGRRRALRPRTGNVRPAAGSADRTSASGQSQNAVQAAMPAGSRSR